MNLKNIYKQFVMDLIQKNARDIWIKAQQTLQPTLENENFNASKLNRLRLIAKN